jgi:hypothetical protein
LLQHHLFHVLRTPVPLWINTLTRGRLPEAIGEGGVILVRRRARGLAPVTERDPRAVILAPCDQRRVAQRLGALLGGLDERNGGVEGSGGAGYADGVGELGAQQDLFQVVRNGWKDVVS